MAYVDSTSTPAARTKAILGVGTIHAIMAVGVYTGLTITGVIAPPDKVLTSWDVATPVPQPVPPPPEDQVEQVRQTTSYVPPKAPDRRLELPSETPVIVDRFDDGPIMPEIPREIPGAGASGPGLVAPTPSPSVGLPAIGPKALNSPAAWITTDDYPSRELMRGNEGTARYRLVISSGGRVESCEITQGTGFSRLDAETCRLLSRRARFEPAKDSSGAGVVGTFTGVVTWQIP